VNLGKCRVFSLDIFENLSVIEVLIKVAL